MPTPQFDLSTAPLQVFHSYGPGFASIIGAMPFLSDEGHAACPPEWRDLTALIHTLVADEGYSTGAAAWEAAVPEAVVAAYRKAAGI